MENQIHLFRLSQPLLDAHHKGMSARDAARELGAPLFNSGTTALDVMAMMLDDAERARFCDHERLGAQDVPVEQMIAELLSRLFARWQSLQLCPDAYQIFLLARDFIDTRSRMIDTYRAHRGVMTLKNLNIHAMQCLDASDSIYQRAVYLSRAWFNILGLRSGRLIELLCPERSAELSSILNAGHEGLTSPWQSDAQSRILEGFQDRELGIRIMHALRRNRLATYDPAYPVAGVRSIYVLIPLLISYLTHPNEQMESRMHSQLTDLTASLGELSLQMEAVNKRYARLRTTSL